MKKVLHTQKLTQSRYLVLLASGYKKSSIWHPEWHVDAYSVIGRLQTTSATNPPVVTDQDVPLHPIQSAVQFILSPSYQQPSYPPPLFSPTIASLTSLPDHTNYLSIPF